jgi:hypothetical protein
MLTTSKPRIAAFLAAAAATLAVAPAAHATDPAPIITGTVSATGTVDPDGAAPMALGVPSITGGFTKTLTGHNETATATVGAWTVNDRRGNGAGYNVNVTAGDPTIGGKAFAASDGAATVEYAGPAAGAMSNTDTMPDAEKPTNLTGAQDLRATGGKQIVTADTNHGLGAWTFPTADLTLGIPANARKGAYSTVLTFTLSGNPLA